MAFIVSIDGNIAAGKTTILQEIEKQGYPVFYEPFEDNIYLEDFYREQGEYATRVQQYFLTLRRNQFLAAQHSFCDPDRIVFIERSIFTDKYIFANMLYQEDKISEQDWKAYIFHFETLKHNKPDFAIVLNVRADICLERIKDRSRDMESSIPIDYLQKVDSYYNLYGHNLGVTVRKNYYPFEPDEIARIITGTAETEVAKIKIVKDRV